MISSLKLNSTKINAFNFNYFSKVILLKCKPNQPKTTSYVKKSSDPIDIES